MKTGSLQKASQTSKNKNAGIDYTHESSSMTMGLRTGHPKKTTPDTQYTSPESGLQIHKN